MNVNQKQLTGYIFTSLLSLVLLSIFVSVPAWADSEYYFIRHAEFDKKDPAKPLTSKGKMRAMALVEHFKDVKLTHIYATHTNRTRETVAPLGKQHNITVSQFPPLGSKAKGGTVTNLSKGKIAIKPMTAALKNISDGDVVVVSANSGNMFAIMAGLGVHVGSKEKPCDNADGSCLPCKNKSCFPKKDFHNIWKIVVSDNGATMTKSHYGKVRSKK